MSDIIAAADETAFTTLLHDAETLLGTPASSGSSSLGPFGTSYSASVNFSGGTVKLQAPNVVEIANLNIHYSVSFSFSLDLNDFLPSFCLPRICVFGFCTPKICINWPTIRIPFSFSDDVQISADFSLDPHLSGGNWLIDVVMDGVPLLQFGAATAAILAALAAAIFESIGAVPFIGPFLAAVIDAIIAVIGIAGLTGLLGDIITPFVQGLRFNVYNQPQLFNVLPASGALSPAVNINIASIDASVQVSDKAEFVIAGDITA